MKCREIYKHPGTEPSINSEHDFNSSAFVFIPGRTWIYNQTAFIDMSMPATTTTSTISTTSSTTSIPLLGSSTTVFSPTSTAESEEEESPDSSVSSMFSTSMAPPQPTPPGQEEELITTVAPTIKDEDEDADDVTAAPDLDIDDFVSANVSDVEVFRGDTFPKPQSTTESSYTTESVSKSDVGEPDSVIEINTIQPDVPKPDESVITEPMFAEGKTEETILDSRNTTSMASDFSDTPTESTELTSEEVFSFSELAPFPTDIPPDYDNNDEIGMDYGVEALPPPRPFNQDLSTRPTDSTDFTAVTETTFMSDTQTGSEVAITTTGLPGSTSTAAKTTPQMQGVEISGTTSAEDMTSSTSVHVFDESTTHLPKHSTDNLTDETATAEIGTEFFTSAPVVLTVTERTTAPGPAGTDTESTEGTTVIVAQNASGKTKKN